MKAVVAAFNQEKALVGAFSVITNLRMELFEALIAAPLLSDTQVRPHPGPGLLHRVGQPLLAEHGAALPRRHRGPRHGRERQRQRRRQLQLLLLQPQVSSRVDI